MLHIKSNAILRIASVISFFLIWQFSSLFFDVDLLPSPHSVFSKIIEESLNRELFFHTAIKRYRKDKFAFSWNFYWLLVTAVGEDGRL